jgi:hypothetical protein
VPSEARKRFTDILPGAGTEPAIVSITNRTDGPESRTTATPDGSRPLDKAYIVSAICI